MLYGEDVFILSTGTKCKVKWSRPDVGVDITEEEQQARMQKFAETWLDILTSDCQELLDAGKPEVAEKRWRETGLDIPPFWLDKEND